MNSTTASTAENPATPILVDQTMTELSATGKRMIWAILISALFLTQIAYNIGDFPVGLDLVCYALFTAYLLFSGYAAINAPIFFLLTCAIALAAFSIPFSRSLTSWSSLALLFLLYLPFAFHLPKRQDIQAVQDYISNAYVAAASIIAAIAVAQIVLVNVLHLSFLANIYFVLPQAIRGAGTYTFLREGGGLIKANGFFLRESADLSFVAALALLLEYRSRKRLKTLGLLAAGLLVSLSGTGLIALIAGLVLPKSISRIPMFLAYALGLFLFIFMLYSLDIPALALWFDRLSEFSTPNTSGYARFVAPMNMLEFSFDNGYVTALLGNGAGSFPRDVSRLKFKYEVSDPTWAKLTYEYGLIGLALVSSLVIKRLYSSSLTIEICNFLLFSWISVAFVLKPGYVLTIWLLTLVPRMGLQSNSRT